MGINFLDARNKPIFNLAIFALPVLFQIFCTQQAIGDLILQKPPTTPSSIILPSQYGTGADGDITITAPGVNITDLYENDSVTGATTARGVNKGLNKGAGTFDPQNGIFIQAKNFTIATGASLTAYQRAANNKQGIIWITCTEAMTIGGNIDLLGKGYSGGAGATGGGVSGSPGLNSGGGSPGASNGASQYGGGGGGAGHIGTGTTGTQTVYNIGGAGGGTYGVSSIPTTTWSALYGSGGGGGGGAGANGKTGAAGGNGGGVLRLICATITNSATVSVNGATGSNTGQSSGGGGGGGGGSGGTAYLESLNTITLGSNVVSALAGSGGSGADGANPGGAGSDGRIHIVGSYTGSTTPTPQ